MYFVQLMVQSTSKEHPHVVLSRKMSPNCRWFACLTQLVLSLTPHKSDHVTQTPQHLAKV